MFHGNNVAMARPGLHKQPAIWIYLLLAAATSAHAQTDGAAKPQSLDDLFKPVGESAAASNELREPIKVLPGTDQLPSLTGLTSSPESSEKGRAADPTVITGFYQNDLAYTYGKPGHWSKFRNTLDLATTGNTDGGIAWKLGGRFIYDPIYDLSNYYNAQVRDNQRLEASIREAYFDFSGGGWDFRLGRQHIIWGEMVGLFFADVVSAKDLRELALPEFDILRIPQWAGRAEYFSGDFHAEAVVIPYMTYENIGKPGAEFYPFTPPSLPGVTSYIAKEEKPTQLKNSAYGIRLSQITSGWDISGFLYSTQDPAAAFSRQLVAPTTIAYRPVHDRILQVGATLGKDLGPLVLKSEAVYTKNKQSYVNRASDADGLVKQDMLDYIIGLEWSFPEETRFNLQFYQRWFPDHDPDLYQDTTESGVSVMFSTQALHPKLEPKILLIRSLDRNDWLAQLKLTWRLDGNWRAVFGADVFGGTGLFGQFDSKDRVYSEVRYSF